MTGRKHWNSRSPVSYTHLDVYKRQDIDKAALERGIPGRTVRDAQRELGDALNSKIVEGRNKVFWMD